MVAPSLTQKQGILDVQLDLVAANDTANGNIVVNSNKNLLSGANQIQLVPLAVIDAWYIESQLVVATPQIDVYDQVAPVEADAQVIFVCSRGVP